MAIDTTPNNWDLIKDLSFDSLFNCKIPMIKLVPPNPIFNSHKLIQNSALAAERIN